MNYHQMVAVQTFGHQIIEVSDRIKKCLDRDNGVFIPWEHPDFLDAYDDAWPLVCIKDATVYCKENRVEVVTNPGGSDFVVDCKPTGWFLMRGTKAYRKHRERWTGGWGMRKNEDLYDFASWLGGKFYDWHSRTGKFTAVVRTWRNREQHYRFANASVEKAFISEFRSAFFEKHYEKTKEYDFREQWLQIEFGVDGSFYMLYDPKNKIDRRMVFDLWRQAQETAFLQSQMTVKSQRVSA